MEAAEKGGFMRGVFSRKREAVAVVSTVAFLAILVLPVLLATAPAVAANGNVGATEWYLAEGSTTNHAEWLSAGFVYEGKFETFILIQNPNNADTRVDVTYMTPGGPVQGPSNLLVDANSRVTINVAATEGVEDQASVSTFIESLGSGEKPPTPVVVERSMYYTSSNYNMESLIQQYEDLPAPGLWRMAATDSIGITQPSQTWYLAEGSAGQYDNGWFETWILVQNPNDVPANVTLTYMTPTGPVEGPAVILLPNSRQSINMADTPFMWREQGVSTLVESDQPVVAERAMYWGGRTMWPGQEGHREASLCPRMAATCSIGVTEANTEWYLAEGSTGLCVHPALDGQKEGHFETFVLVQNPNDDPANVLLTYMTPGGAVTGPQETLEPRSRRTFNVGETPAVARETSVSTFVISDRPVIAERSMYWSGDNYGFFRMAAHNSIGVTEPRTQWNLAEGAVGLSANGALFGQFNTYILVQNPGTNPANVQLTFMGPEGPVGTHDMLLEPMTRQTVSAAQYIDIQEALVSFSTDVQSDEPVIAERSMYWNGLGYGYWRQAATDSIGSGL